MDDEMYEVSDYGGDASYDTPSFEPEVYSEPEEFEAPEVFEEPETFEEPEAFEEPEIFEDPEVFENVEEFEAPEDFADPETFESDDEFEVTETFEEPEDFAEPEVLETSDELQADEGFDDDISVEEEPEIIEGADDNYGVEGFDEQPLDNDPEIFEEADGVDEAVIDGAQEEASEDQGTDEGVYDVEGAADGGGGKCPVCGQDPCVCDGDNGIDGVQTDDAVSTDVPTHYDSVGEYYGAHNYTPDDYDTYSQDPEWRRLMAEEFPDAQLPPLNQEVIDEVLAPYEGKTYDSVSEYLGDHNFGKGDYDIYSQDREWRRLMQQEYPDAVLPPLNQQTVDRILEPYEGKTYGSLNDYLSDHNFGKSDYEIYSQDREWRRLMQIEHPDAELPPLTQASIDRVLAPYDGKTYDSVGEYLGDHNFGKSDYEIYSQDPVWQQLNLNADVSTDKYGEIKEWLPEINPNFDVFDYKSPYCNNCGSCAYAVWRRLEGDTSICATAENIPFNEDMTALTGMEQVSMSPEDIERSLLEQGNGAHAIIGVDRSDNQPGHWFNAVCMNGKVYAIDGQSNEIRDWPPDYGDVINWEMSVKKR